MIVNFLLSAIALGMTFLYGSTGEIITEKANGVYFSNAQRPTKVKRSPSHCSATTSFPSKFHLASILNDSQLESP